MQIRLAIVGAGTISAYQRKALELVSDRFRLVAVCDIDRGRLDALRQEKGMENVRFFDSVDDLLRHSEADGILISTPPAAHREIVLSCLDRGKKVLVEKPVAATKEDYTELCERGVRKGAFLHTAFHAAFASDLEWYEANFPNLQKKYHMGRLIRVSSCFSDPYFENGRVTEDRRGLGGCWIDSGVNQLSVCDRLLNLSGFQPSRIIHERENGGSGMPIRSLCSFTDKDQEIILESAWNMGLNQKKTVLFFENEKIQLLLHHSLQSVYLFENGREELLYRYDGQERLVRQYVGVLEDFAEACEAGKFNLEKSRRIHDLLFQCVSDGE